MKFPYQEKSVIGIGHEKVIQVYRPMVQIWTYGPDGVHEAYGLADTGAILMPDQWLPRLGVVPISRDNAIITGINGDPILVRYARVDLRVATSGESYRWSARVGFYSGYKVILDHQGFFDAFTASFNGRRRILTLTPNGTAPKPIFEQS